MEKESTKLQLSVSESGGSKSDDASVSELIPPTTDSREASDAAIPTRLEKDKLGQVDSVGGIIDTIHEKEPPVGLSNTKQVDGGGTQADIRSCIVHAPDSLRPISELISETKKDDDRRYAHLNKATGMSERLGVYYQIIPPGYRTACIVLFFIYCVLQPDPCSTGPHAHSKEDELVFCLQGRGTIWQNGWIYPFEPGDVAGWTAGTGITHCIINDTKQVPGRSDEEEEDLILLVVGENKPREDELHYPHNPERYEDGEILRWENVTLQNEGGAHPGVARAERPNDTLPGYQLGARPSNIVNWRDQLAPAGEGELFAYATSLSQETGLSGRFGCNLEVIPPGARSSGMSFYV
jgi:uncharacterized cupin superfamily protein